MHPSPQSEAYPPRPDYKPTTHLEHHDPERAVDIINPPIPEGELPPTPEEAYARALKGLTGRIDQLSLTEDIWQPVKAKGVPYSSSKQAIFIANPRTGRPEQPWDKENYTIVRRTEVLDEKPRYEVTYRVGRPPARHSSSAKPRIQELTIAWNYDDKHVRPVGADHNVTAENLRFIHASLHDNVSTPRHYEQPVDPANLSRKNRLAHYVGRMLGSKHVTGWR